MSRSMSVHRPIPQMQLTGGKADATDAVRLILQFAREARQALLK